jgi:hypothetical protein
VAAVYALAGSHPAGAMALNAVLGALAALAVHRLAARAGSRRAAALAGMLVAVHPGLVAYTPALMTEGITASLLACAAWAAAWARDRRVVGPSLLPFAVVGAVVGLATLVRPQSLLLAPAFAWIAESGTAPGASSGSLANPVSALGGFARTSLAAPPDPQAGSLRPMRRRLAAVLIALSAALAVCAPWSARNCVRMGRCALVSVNAGWNLLIGADPEARGAWAPIKVPAACREVFDEAGKDACFAREARLFIAERPGKWLSLVPRKLAATFDYCGAAGWYLHASNPDAFSEGRKLALGAVETLYERLAVLLCIAWAARLPVGASGSAVDPGRAPGTFRRRTFVVLHLTIAVLGALAMLHVHAWIGHVALLALALLRGRGLLQGPLLAPAALAVLAATALTHAVFFGAGRYGLVAFPLLTGLAALALTLTRPRELLHPSAAGSVAPADTEPGGDACP